MLACGGPALAQYGVSNARDGNGNLVRNNNNGTNSGRVINQGPINNGPISTAPAQPPTTNSRINTGVPK
jgi:hypothetical protein